MLDQGHVEQLFRSQSWFYFELELKAIFEISSRLNTYEIAEMSITLVEKMLSFQLSWHLNRDKTTTLRNNFNLTKHEFDMKYEIEKTKIQIFG